MAWGQHNSSHRCHPSPTTDTNTTCATLQTAVAAGTIAGQLRLLHTSMHTQPTGALNEDGLCNPCLHTHPAMQTAPPITTAAGAESKFVPLFTWLSYPM
jgi:hypothetical protein